MNRDAMYYYIYNVIYLLSIAIYYVALHSCTHDSTSVIFEELLLANLVSGPLLLLVPGILLDPRA